MNIILQPFLPVKVSAFIKLIKLKYPDIIHIKLGRYLSSFGNVPRVWVPRK